MSRYSSIIEDLTRRINQLTNNARLLEADIAESKSSLEIQQSELFTLNAELEAARETKAFLESIGDSPLFVHG